MKNLVHRAGMCLGVWCFLAIPAAAESIGAGDASDAYFGVDSGWIQSGWIAIDWTKVEGFERLSGDYRLPTAIFSGYLSIPFERPPAVLPVLPANPEQVLAENLGQSASRVASPVDIEPTVSRAPVAGVPEPCTLVLLSCGIAALWIFRANRSA